MGRPPTISRQQLLETARGVFSRKGYAAATLAGIAAELGVTAAAILRHTRSKESLFAEAMTLHLHEVPPFFALLTEQGAEERPREVLATFAVEFVRFLRYRIGEVMAVAMHVNAGLPQIIEASLGEKPQTVPVRALAAIQSYFRRCMKAGTMRELPPRAAALVFIGALQSYVIFHEVLHIAPNPLPLKPYIETLLDTWSGGAFVKSSARKRLDGGARGKTTQGR